jgi:hypothetical protein
MVTESLPVKGQPLVPVSKPIIEPKGSKAAVFKTLDANESAAYVAYQLNEVIRHGVK